MEGRGWWWWWFVEALVVVISKAVAVEVVVSDRGGSCGGLDVLVATRRAR